MEHSSFNNFDLFAVGTLLLSGIFAFRRGFVKEIFSLGSWVAAAVIAAIFFPSVKPWLMENHIKNELAASALAALGLFGATLLVLIPTGDMLAGLIKGPTMTSVDRSLGFVFGLLRGFLVLSLIFLCLSWIWPQEEDQPAWLAEAKIKPLLEGGAEVLKDLVPKEEREIAEEEIEKTREAAEKAIEDAKRLDEMSTPTPGKKERKPSSSYGDDLRGIMNDLTGSKK